jgi:hypothetical protein
LSPWLNALSYTYAGHVEIKIHTLQNLALDEDEWSASSSVHFTAKETPLSTGQGLIIKHASGSQGFIPNTHLFHVTHTYRKLSQ